jgi:hypothetical protein
MSLPNQMNRNALTKEKLKQNPKRKMINKLNLPQMSNKFQGADVHSWEDQRRREILTFSK